jgi:2-keto-4-pentenoate hydratase/2-oxohepta-3-ene-1,7-dioic acid hydratase in catechol pathway
VSPIRTPQKIVCVGLNYRDHAEEGGAEIPSEPILFAKWPNTLVGPGDAIRLPALSQFVDYEGELGVVVGRRAARVSVEEAPLYIAGYVAANDVTARDLQLADGQWVRSKSFDTFLPVSEMTSADQVVDPQDLRIRTILNGRVVQDSSTANMIFGVNEILSFVSQAITLEPDDLILTGTPAGVGLFREPKLRLEDGDEIMVEIEGVGEITNPVVG